MGEKHFVVPVKSTMDANEAGKRLPVPVKEIVRNLRQSSKTDTRPRPRRFSDICPNQSGRSPFLTTKWPLTPTGLSSTPTFFPPSCTPATFNSSKTQTAANKMDVFIQSPGFGSHCTSSPLSSIYDQEKSGSFCGTSTFSNLSMDSVVSDEVCESLDDNLEDGSLDTLLTPDVIDTLNRAAAFNSSPELTQWSVKLESDVPLSAVEDCLRTNSVLTQDTPFVNDVMNISHHDTKLSYIDYDISVTSGLCSPAFNSLTSGFVQASGDIKSQDQILCSSQDLGFAQKNSPDAASAYSQNPATLRSHFPPRASQPQVGVAAVIKSGTSDSLMFHSDSQLGRPKRQTSSLHELLSIKPELQLKSEIFSPTKSQSAIRCHSSGVTDRSVQIVPSSTCAVKRTYSDSVKSEVEFFPAVTKEKSMEEKWQDVQSFMRSPEQESVRSKRRRCDSGSSEHISEDEDDECSSFGEKDPDDSDDDYSDIDADLAQLKPSECESLLALGKKQKQFFWQYNIQSKGPKGTRLKLAVESPSDPHVLNNFEDPVFDACNTAIAGIRHGGKARKGDGNEITPNPKKLVIIGHQLMRLNHQINACQLGIDVPLARRNESRKEKNKLASRACRLKKKAQHEANKIKLYGLEQEHSQLNTVLQFIWPHIRDRARAHMRATEKLSSTSDTLTRMLESQISLNMKSMIAGHTVDYVNSIILKVESGDSSGGLNVKKSLRT